MAQDTHAHIVHEHHDDDATRSDTIWTIVAIILLVLSIIFFGYLAFGWLNNTRSNTPTNTNQSSPTNTNGGY